MNRDLANHVRKKQEELEKARERLKKDFVGLNEIIDQIIESIQIWYIFPELQIRPTIVCLWGLTGVGKTDLVRKMVSYLGMQDRFLEIELSGVNDSSITIQKRLEQSSIASEDQCLLFLDEMQKFRTVNRDGSNNDVNTAYSDLWTLLSDGKFQADLSRKTELIEEILYSKYWKDYSQSEEEADDSVPQALGGKPKKKAKKEKKKVERMYHTPVYLARRVKRLFRLEESIEDIMKWDDQRIFDLYERHASNPQIYEGETYKKMLIIISGNLDEAYTMAGDVEEADLDADYYHEVSKKLTVLDIKDALEDRFRPEQIARFGNTHILYPALSRKNYEEIIVLKCGQINELVKESKGITIQYDQSVYTAMYNNGVFPTQGVRPLLSTITNILSAALPTFLFECILTGVSELDISVEKSLMFTKVKGKRLEVEIPTVLDKLRREMDADTRSVVAVHELGHAIAYAVLFGVTPKQICVDSISPYNNGFVLQHQLRENKDTITQQIQVCLAGRVAEEMVFGTGMSSTGACKDLEQATQLAWAYVGRYAYDGYVGHLTQKSNDSDYEIFNREEIGKLAEGILKDAKTRVTDLLNKRMPMFKKMLKHLMANEKMSRVEFIKIAKTFKLNLDDIADGERLTLGYHKVMSDFLKGTKTT